MAEQTVGASITMDADADTVWAAANDPRTFAQIIDWVYDAWREDRGPLRQGSTYVERAKPGPKEGLYRWVITACDPPRRAVHSHKSGELEADLEIVLDPLDGNRTRYTQTMRFRALPSFRPLGFVLERTVMKRKMQRDFDEMVLPNLKRLVEQRANAAPLRPL